MVTEEQKAGMQKGGFFPELVLKGEEISLTIVEGAGIIPQESSIGQKRKEFH